MVGTVEKGVGGIVLSGQGGDRRLEVEAEPLLGQGCARFSTETATCSSEEVGTSLFYTRGQ